MEARFVRARSVKKLVRYSRKRTTNNFSTTPLPLWERAWVRGKGIRKLFVVPILQPLGDLGVATPDFAKLRAFQNRFHGRRKTILVRGQFLLHFFQ